MQQQNTCFHKEMFVFEEDSTSFIQVANQYKIATTSKLRRTLQ
jgi:hypothetical protein